MKLIDAILNVNRPVESSELDKWCNIAPVDAICESLGLQYFDITDDAVGAAIKAYPIFTWTCTDAEVGLYALYLGDTPVGSCYRGGRKHRHEIRWLSEAAAREVRDFILQHMAPPDFTLVDPDEDIGEDFNVEYAGQPRTDEGLFEGRPVKALVWYDSLGRTTPEQYRREGRAYTVGVPYNDPKADCVLIQDGDVQRVIPFKQFRLAFNVKK